MRVSRTFWKGILVAILCMAIDQASKWYLLTEIGIGEREPIVILPFFNLIMVWNYGISFGMLSGHNQPLLLAFMAMAISGVLFVWLSRVRATWVAAALGLVIGGALANVIDRLRFGAVADFFDFHLLGYHWPAFNIADSCIFIGVVLLCIDSMLEAKKKK
jgi:signal peptidase II